MTAGITPSQTVGPYLALALPWQDGPYVVQPDTPGAIVITGRVMDGVGAPLPDALVETWQADPDGRFSHPDDPHGAAAPAVPGFRGFGRSATGSDGGYQIVTVRPGSLPAPGGATEAPHLDVSVYARGLLDLVVTRIYFPAEAAANAAGPVLSAITDPQRRATLIAEAAGAGPVPVRHLGAGRARDRLFRCLIECGSGSAARLTARRTHPCLCSQLARHQRRGAGTTGARVPGALPGGPL